MAWMARYPSLKSRCRDSLVDIAGAGHKTVSYSAARVPHNVPHNAGECLSARQHPIRPENSRRELNKIDFAARGELLILLLLT